MIKKNKLLKRVYIILYILIIIICVKSTQIYLLNTNLFSSYNILINGNKYIDTSIIENIIYPQLTTSILSLNLNEIQKNIESIDYIESVQVSQILPHSVIINIIESSPIVLVHKLNENIFIDKNGLLLPADKKSIATFSVPIVSILDINKSLNDIQDVTYIFQFLLTEYPEFYNTLNEIKIKPNLWEFSSNNTKIFTENEYVKNQLIILQYFESTIYPVKTLQDYSYIDLRINNQVIVKEKYRKG